MRSSECGIQTVGPDFNSAFRTPHSALESGQGGIRTPEGTSPPDLQSGAIDRSATCPVQRPTAHGRASGGTRTHDQRFTKPLLYQLSYAGEGRKFKHFPPALSFGLSFTTPESTPGSGPPGARLLWGRAGLRTSSLCGYTRPASGARSTAAATTTSGRTRPRP